MMRTACWVSAFLSLLLSCTSSTSPVTSQDQPATPTVAGVRACPGDGKATLWWDAYPGAVGYTVYWAAGPTVTTGAANKSSALADTSFTLSKLVNGQAYSFLVEADRGPGKAPVTGTVAVLPRANHATANQVNLNITSNSETSRAFANGYVYSLVGGRTFLNGATLYVDGTVLVKQSFNAYSAQMASAWADGSSHVVHIVTADGGVFSGTVTKPVGTLTGVTYSPTKNDPLALSYTVSPPAGGWPVGATVVCTYEKAGSTTALPRYPTGNGDVVYMDSGFIGATSISFSTSLRTVGLVEGFDASSVIAVSGTPTPW